MISPAPVNVVGCGPGGALTALLLARRGFPVSVYERRSDPRRGVAERGRSINLALAARGIRALEQAGVMPNIRPLLVPMRGRLIHETDGRTALLPYGQSDREVVFSISRAALTVALVEAVARQPAVQLHFRHPCLGLQTRESKLRLRDAAAGRDYEVALAPTIAADGAGSEVRASLVAAELLADREDLLDHDYKELTIGASAGQHVLQREALHIWPRGGFMLIALPNTDGTFTATLFLPRAGPVSFATLKDGPAVQAFFAREFADVVPFIANLAAQFHEHPQGRLGTVFADPWHLDGQVLLLGDAAHAIVPFHGQGMNCAFEDCIVLDRLIERSASWQAAFAAFSRERRPNTDAIAAMALENYVEMRDTVRDPKFVGQKTLALALEREFPRRFIPRYSMVMFHPEIPYAEAQRRGTIQQQLLDEIDAIVGTQVPADPGQLRDTRVRQLIEARLPPL
ncbi:MAG: NAD(P)/FAD-dependent oxidoreductase [Steroidobacteraceae bacterium]